MINFLKRFFKKKPQFRKIEIMFTANGYEIGTLDKRVFIINPISGSINELGGDINDAITYCLSIQEAK